jgi:hypothetical protein
MPDINDVSAPGMPNLYDDVVPDFNARLKLAEVGGEEKRGAIVDEAIAYIYTDAARALKESLKDNEVDRTVNILSSLYMNQLSYTPDVNLIEAHYFHMLTRVYKGMAHYGHKSQFLEVFKRVVFKLPDSAIIDFDSMRLKFTAGAGGVVPSKVLSDMLSVLAQTYKQDKKEGGHLGSTLFLWRDQIMSIKWCLVTF